MDHVPAKRRSALLPTVMLVALVALAAAPAACARARGPPRTEAIDMVVIHSTGGPTCDAEGRPVWVGGGMLAEDLRTIEAHPVLGIHYMVDRDGTVRASVPEDQVAWHAYTVSGRSIAIELVNDGDGIDPFPPAQLRALEGLLRDIVRRRGVARGRVVRHSDIDRTRLPCDRHRRRKVDPGDAFPYQAVLDAVFARQEATPQAPATPAPHPGKNPPGGS